jgi:hypothetical protein
MEYKVYVNGNLVAIGRFTTDEVKAINNCNEIRLVKNK